MLLAGRIKRSQPQKDDRQMARRIASSILQQVKVAPKSDKVVVFLGGECPDDNSWRNEIKQEFSGRIHFIDPFDPHWEPDDNIYDELAGMIRSDYVIFYKGGKGSQKEKQFLDLVGDDEYEEFEDLDELREYLERISEPTR